MPNIVQNSETSHSQSLCRQYVNQIIVTDHNETNSLSFMQRNLRHIWGHDAALPSPIRHFGGGPVPPVPRGIYATVLEHRLTQHTVYCLTLSKKTRPINVIQGRRNETCGPHQTPVRGHLASPCINQNAVFII